ncbi:hypothetical protein GQ53DRAFT_820276 [Thozetella sp. PMI_491]|nr:hypothetical protein GQ53DRAFT_820276 [Thozetella sp. PMI_491]
MTTFTIFPMLPMELQDAIWAFAVPQPEPEVCIVWPLVIRYWNGEQPALPLMVDTAWPTVAHVCRRARASLISSRALRLRHSSIAGLDVPCRAFDPAIDTLYWDQSQAGAMEVFLQQPENAALARSLRHLAVELPAIYPPSRLAELIRQKAVFLRNLTLVVPDFSDDYSVRTAFLPPARRCRLRDVPGAVSTKMTLTDVPFLEPHLGRTLVLQEYVKRFRADLDRHVRKFNISGDDNGTAWNARDEGFSGLQIRAQTFVQYAAGRWDEVYGHRELGQDGGPPQPRHIPPGERKNPHDYRVLDDDCGCFSQDQPATTLMPEDYSVPLVYDLEIGLNGWR